MAERKNFFTWFRGLSRNQKIRFLAGCAVIFYTVFGFLVAPLICKKILEKKLPQLLNRQVAIEKIKLNPYSLSASIEGFSLAKKEGSGAFVYFDKLYVNLESLSLFKKALIVKSISIAGPFIDFDFLGDKTYSFSDLLVGKDTKKDTEADQSPALFSINNIEIKDGNIKFNDLSKEKSHQVVKLNLAIPSISNLPSSIETYVQPAFSAVINGTLTSLGGVTKPFAKSLATEVEINMQRINIPHYLAYIPNHTDLTVKSALMDIDAKLTYVSGFDKTSRLGLVGTISLRGINIVDKKGQSYLNIPSLTVIAADSNLLEKEVRLAEIRVDAPRLELFRLANGDILPLAMLATVDGDSPATPVEKMAEDGIQGSKAKLTIDSFNLGKGEVIFSDQALQNPTKISVGEISLQASNLSTIHETVGAISYAMLMNGTGSISGSGNLSIKPLALKSSLDINSIRLKDFQPYVSEQAQVIITSGIAALQGDLEVKQDKAGATEVDFFGQSSVSKLATADTLTGDDLLKWKDLQVGKIKYSSTPPELFIDEINWQDIYVKVLVNKDGTVNLATLDGKDQKDETSPVPVKKGITEDDEVAAPEKKITINKVSLSNAQIQFLDKNIKPAYGTNLSELNGVITGLSSLAESRASIKFAGKVDQQAPLIIIGELNLLSQENFADIKIDFSDFNMSPLSPYTGKYVGQKTSKGKLNLDMSYEIRGQKLNSTNKAFLDQFTLGAKVDSPDATSLPVNLAIALLKNRQGEIFLDIPVSGDLNDPEFSIGGVVFKVIFNLIAKAATSPFALLANLIPAGQDLQYVNFEAGSGGLSKDTVDKLGLVAKVLYERPGLNMDILGRIDRGLDSKALARINMDKQIKLEKLKQTGSRKANKIVDLESVQINPEEYIKYLKMVYKKTLKTASAEEQDATRGVKPATEAEAVTKMEDFILARIKVEDGELRLLAIDRANRVLRYLIEEGQVKPKRLFIVEPQMAVMGEDDQKLSNTMVELLIK